MMQQICDVIVCIGLKKGEKFSLTEIFLFSVDSRD